MLGERSVRLALGVFGVGVLAAPAFAAWVITEITPLPHWGGSVEVTDINSSGVICGMGNYVVNVSATAFRYDGTTVTELPFLPNASEPIALTTDINAQEVVSGFTYDESGRLRAVYWDSAAVYLLPYPADANTNADMKANGINDAGVLVGYFWKPGSERTAFYYRDGVSYSLDAIIRAAGLAGMQIARGINEHNVVCGSADNAMGIENAWIYDIDADVLTVIGAIGTGNCSATRINKHGQTIGRGTQFPGDSYRAVTYDGTWHIVDDTESSSQWGNDVNDNGRMVGSAYIGSNNRKSWYSDGPGSGSMVPIEIPTWQSVNVQAINNSDWMAGFGRPPGAGVFEQRGFILTPPPGDTDHDGNVGLDDFAEFAACLSGPKEAAGFVPPSAACLQTFDFDPADGDVDAADFAGFQHGFEGN